MPLGASGMYQRRCALERPVSDLFRVLSRSKPAIPCQIAPGLGALARTCAKAQFPGQGSGGEPSQTRHGRTRAKAVDDACSSCRGPQTKSKPGGYVTDTFDFVVIGGGSGGCAVAGRLSEDPKTSVAVLEAGGAGDNWVVTSPGAMILMISGKVNNWAFDTVPQAGLNGRVGCQPRGKGLGGSSAINAMVYIRGHRSDYDRWASLGNTGWSYADVLPYFKRSEDNSELDGEYHGRGGPLHVTGSRSDNPVREIYLQAAREAQFRIREDFNAEEQEGLGAYQLTQKNGERWSAARGYIHPFMATRANLHVETNAHASRILFEGKRAVGVEYRQGKETKQIRARREVILSSRALQTPPLL